MFKRSFTYTTMGVLLGLLLPTSVLAQIPWQSRVTGTCPSGSSIRVINEDGSVECQVDSTGGVTAVTASSPLVATGTTTRNIALPNVIIEATNTGIGASVLLNNTTGGFNTASGSNALVNNITGSNNTASGAQALSNNTDGNNNTASGGGALVSNTLGNNNTAGGINALGQTTTGNNNTASGFFALLTNTTGNGNTAIGADADVSAENLFNATALGAGAIVNASNKVRLGNAAVTVIEGEVPFSFSSDQFRKENFQPVDGEVVLRKLSGLSVTSWNYIGHNPQQFRHYGPMGQEFFAAFGHDGIGTIGSPTTITSADIAGILMSAVQAMDKRTVDLRQETERLREAVEAFKAENADLKARLERMEQTTTGYITTSNNY